MFGDANFAGFTSTRNFTVGGVALWGGQFVKAWSKTVRFVVLTSEESEQAPVVMPTTEGMGLQSILSDFSLRGHVAIKSDATSATGMVHRLSTSSSAAPATKARLAVISQLFA